MFDTKFKLVILKKPSNHFGGFFINILLLVLIIHYPLHALTIEKIDVNGNSLLSDNEITGFLRIEKGVVLDSAGFYSRINSLAGYYQKLGYFNIIIHPLLFDSETDSNAVVIKVNLEEGKAAVIRNLTLNAMDTFGLIPQLKDRMDLKEGSYFDGFILERDMESILEFLEDHGYPFAEITLTNIEIHAKEGKPEVELVIGVKPGPGVLLEFVESRGNEITRGHLIPRLMKLKLPQQYSERRISAGLKLLRRSSFFSSVTKPMLIQNQFDSWGLVISVNEKPMNAINGVVGYIPGRDSEGGELTGLAELTMRNLWGTCRGIHLKWMSAGNQGREILVEYREPWFLGTAAELNGTFLESRKDTSYTEYNWEVATLIPIGYFTSLTAGIGLQEVVPESVGTYLLSIPESRTLSFSSGFEANLYDRVTNPRTGGAFGINLSFMDKRRDGPDFIFYTGLEKHLFQLKVESEAGLAVLLFPSQVLFTKLNWRSYLVTGKTTSLSDLFRVGGAQSVRGYKEEQFLADMVGWSNLEYRLLLAPRARAFAFADLCWFELDDKPEAKIGWGVGLRFQSNIGMIGVDYGIGEDRTITSGIVHLSVETEF